MSNGSGLLVHRFREGVACAITNNISYFTTSYCTLDER